MGTHPADVTLMKILAGVLLAMLALPVHADSVNVMKAASVLDFKLENPAAAASGATEAFPGALDLDGDGQVSKAEAAGHADVTLGFDRADRNRNGRVSTAEWQRYEKWQARRAKARESASAGATRSKPARRSAP
jgi:hypothetical protein